MPVVEMEDLVHEIVSGLLAPLGMEESSFNYDATPTG